MLRVYNQRLLYQMGVGVEKALQSPIWALKGRGSPNGANLLANMEFKILILASQ